MHRPDRATFDHAGDGLPLSVGELGRLSCRLAIQDTVRTAGVEAQYPVPDDLKSDTADLGRLGARCPIVDSRECYKPASLTPVFGLPCQTANLWRIKILAQWCRSRHDEPPGFAMLNLTRLHLGIAHESQFQGLGIRCRRLRRCRSLGHRRGHGHIAAPFRSRHPRRHDRLLDLIRIADWTADEPPLDLTVVGRGVRKPALECVPLVARQRVADHSEPRIAWRGCAIGPIISNRRPSWRKRFFARAATSARSISDLPPFLAKA